MYVTQLLLALVALDATPSILARVCRKKPDGGGGGGGGGNTFPASPTSTPVSTALPTRVDDESATSTSPAQPTSTAPAKDPLLLNGGGGGGGGGGSGAVVTATGGGSTLHNPPIWEDLADVEAIYVDGTFYLSASNMHYSPGAPLLGSKNLMEWTYVGHSLPKLPLPDMDMPNGRTNYEGGTWASTIKQNPKDGRLYWAGCLDFGKTHVYSAAKPEGPWEKVSILDHCFYDCGMLFDDDGSIYIATSSWGDNHTKFMMGQISADFKSVLKLAQVHYEPSQAVEGFRLYKIDKFYYIFTDNPGRMDEQVFRATNIWGEYTPMPTKFVQQRAVIPGAGPPHQGGIVKDDKDNWYYVGFGDAYPLGRVPCWARMTWVDGWPKLSGDFSTSLTVPFSGPGKTNPNWSTDFSDWPERLEWNHNPDDTKWSHGAGGLVLKTATVTPNLAKARNSLTARLVGPQSQCTVEFDVSNMAAGDRALLAVFGEHSSYIGVADKKIVTRTGITIADHDVSAAGTDDASAPLSGTKVFFRVVADGAPSNHNPMAVFSYSTDGTSFTKLGSYPVKRDKWFEGHRFMVGNHATTALGGSITVKSLDIKAMET